MFRQAGATPAETDALVCSREILWTGAGELTAVKILANKAVQDKITGAIEYYDDDGQTVLLTLAPYDEEDDDLTRCRNSGIPRAQYAAVSERLQDQSLLECR